MFSARTADPVEGDDPHDEEDASGANDGAAESDDEDGEDGESDADGDVESDGGGGSAVDDKLAAFGRGDEGDSGSAEHHVGEEVLNDAIR